jgi:hypothetical protein
VDGPRIVITRFPTAQASRLQLWNQHSERVIGFAPELPADIGDGGAVWHLSAGNNRMVARGARVFTNPDDAREDAARVFRDRVKLTARMVKHGGSAIYGWWAQLDERPVLTCSRWYSTERDRRTSLRLALLVLDEAVIVSGVPTR